MTRDYADGTVGYVRLNGFSDRGATELAAALRAHLDADRTKLILDLRGNPGGYVTAARAVASQFIASGPIFWEEDAAGTQVADRRPARRRGHERPTSRSSCLIDGGSASASEIVAGALQDTGRATLVGQTTFGKGTVQQWQELTGEGGAFRLTDRPLADAEQALDPRRRHRAGRRRSSCRRSWTPARTRRSTGRSSCSAPAATGEPARGRLSRVAAGHRALALATAFGYGSWERKEVMCSDRQYA